MVKALLAGLAFLACCVFTPAHAAGFDCAKAGSPVEKLICASPELSVLDSDMTRAYKTAFAGSDIPKDLAASQRSWMKWRGACLDKGLSERDEADCLALQYRGRIQFLAHPKFCKISRLADCDDTNQLMGQGGDEAIQRFLAHDRKASSAMRSVLGGPPEDIVTLANGWKMAAACRAHDCGSKGAMILTPGGQLVASALLCIYPGGGVSDYGLTLYLRAEEDRAVAVGALESWAKESLAKQYVPPSFEPYRISRTEIRIAG